MKKLLKKLLNSTVMKYLFSYIIIFTVLEIGTFMILSNQLMVRFSEQLNQQVKVQLNNLTCQLNKEIENLYQIDSSIKGNSLLVQIKHVQKGWSVYQTYYELRKYDGATPLIRSIVYMTENLPNAFSTETAVGYEDGIFSFYAEGADLLFFDPNPYLGNLNSQLIFLSNDSQKRLIYLPGESYKADEMFFYLLDYSEIQQIFSYLESDEVLAIALIDSEKQLVTGLNEELLHPYLDSLQIENGMYYVDDSYSVFVDTGIKSGFAVVALVSGEVLSAQIRDSFFDSYIIFFCVACVGFLLVFIAMRITYSPLYRLVKKIVPDASYGQEHIGELETAFFRSENRSEMLLDKLNKYRFSMQKELLDTYLISENAKKTEDLYDLDMLFDMENNNQNFVLKMFAPQGSLPSDSIRKRFLEVLTEGSICIILKAEPDSATFLIDYVGWDRDKDKVLNSLMLDYYKECGYYCAISNGSNSPLEIPSLCENANTASYYWLKDPVVCYEILSMDLNTLIYPHEKLQQLTDALNEQDFQKVKDGVDQLFAILDENERSSAFAMQFFSKCVLIDILTVIVKAMNQNGIKFKCFSELYFESLYLCRSYSYKDRKGAIHESIFKLLSTYEQVITDKIINFAQIKKIIEESYCQPDFSITLLADQFHVSIAYMSYLIKSELGRNFSEYLWILRYEKAKQMLESTDMPIDDISVAVGYLNTSSFRRKFKQMTGISPSQYRNGPGGESSSD